MYCKKCGNNYPDNQLYCNKCGEPNSAATANKIIHKNNFNILIVSIISLSAVIIAVVIGIIAFLPANKTIDTNETENGSASFFSNIISNDNIGQNKTTTDVVMYISNNKYMLISDIDNPNPIEISPTNSYTNTDDWRYENVKFSPDGTYVYFKIGDYGTLCRVDISNIEQDYENDSIYVETFETNVQEYDVFDDGSIAFWDENRSLYWSDGVRRKKISDNVNYFYIESHGRMIWEGENPDETVVLYGVNVYNLDDITTFSSDLHKFGGIISFDKTFDEIIYESSEGTLRDDNSTIFVTGFGKNTETLVRNVSNYVMCPIVDYINDDSIFYFLANCGTSSEYQILYSYENGQLKTVCENVLSKFGNAWLKPDMPIIFAPNANPNNINYNVDEIKSKTDLSSLEERFGALEGFIVSYEGDIIKLSDNAIKFIVNACDHISYSDFAVTDDYCYLICDSVLYSAEIDNKIIGDFTPIYDDVDGVCYSLSNLLFFTSQHHGKGDGYGYFNLYYIFDGTILSVEKDIHSYQAFRFPDGSIHVAIDTGDLLFYKMQYTDCDKLIKISADGKKEYIADNIHWMSFIDEEHLLYGSENNLRYDCDGEKKIIASNVKAFYHKNLTSDYDWIGSNY